MPAEKTYFVLNLGLILLIFLLLLTLFDVRVPSLGQGLARLDKSSPACFVRQEGEMTSFPDLDRCCLLARQQLSCNFSQNQWECGSGADFSYVLNKKAYYYCLEQPVW